jgi:D-alanyl-D-alanine carboxypeptidase/D-alanyl-D-alanine-endopeptidase (penicillin-binding protein 4)
MVAGFAVCLLLLAPTAASSEQSLESRLEAVLHSRGLAGARVGVLVVAQDDGRVLFQKEPDRPLVPASNQKILTAAAALSAWGPAHQFVTEVYASHAPDAQGGVGTLMLRGLGDPSLTSEQFWRLSADLRMRGVRRVSGGLLLDASSFDSVRWHPTWGKTSARAYHGPVASLSANYGAFAVVVQAGVREGDPVRVRLDPPVPFLRLKNSARTGSSNTRAKLVIDRRRAGTVEEVLVSGVAPAGSAAATYYRSVLDPVGYAGAVFRMQLEANGIVVDGEARVGKVPETAVRILEFKGKSMAEIVKLFLKFSNNTMAETLVKAMGVRSGGKGSWSDGIAATRLELDGLGVELEGVVMIDGSGLSVNNRLTPRSLVSTLRKAQASFRFGPELMAALPIAATDGTLEKRVAGVSHQVRAKTGLLVRSQEVTSLSGYLDTVAGESLVFSILVNDFPKGSAEAMAAVDLFVAELVKGEGGAKGAKVGH